MRAAGWKIKKLDEVSVVASGGTPLKSTVEFWDGDIPWYSSGELNGEFTTEPKAKITACGLEGSNAKLFPKGSLLIGMYDTAAMKMAVLDRDAAFNQAVAGIKPTQSVDLRYVKVALEAIKPTIMEQRRGTRQKNLSLKKIKDIEIPLPPLEEQRKIVAILDEAFEGLDRARKNAEVNLQSARELFESALSAFVKRHEGNWSPTVLGDAYDVRDGTHASPQYHPSGRALITSKNLGRDGLHFEKVKFISEEDFDAIQKRSGVHKGDVLFAMIGTIGNPIVVDVDPDFAIKNVALFKMKDQRSGTFLRYLLRSKHVVEKMRAEAKGTTQQFVGLGYLRSFPVSLPKPVDEDAMVGELEQIETECRSSEDQYVQKLRDLDDLRQSLLQKAFAGELT